MNTKFKLGDTVKIVKNEDDFPGYSYNFSSEIVTAGESLRPRAGGLGVHESLCEKVDQIKTGELGSLYGLSVTMLNEIAPGKLTHEKINDAYKALSNRIMRVDVAGGNDCSRWITSGRRMGKSFITQEFINNYNKPKETIMTTLKRIPKTLKRVLDKDLQAQYKTGLIDEDLELTGKGENELMEVLAIKYREELSDVAREMIKETEEDK